MFRKITYVLLIFFLVHNSAGANAENKSVYDSLYRYILENTEWGSMVLASQTWAEIKSIESWAANEIFIIKGKDGKKISIDKLLLLKLIKVNNKNKELSYSQIPNDIAYNISFINPEVYHLAHHKVSRIAFSKTKKKALVNVTLECLMCGGSWLYYLELNENRWEVKGISTLFVT